MDRVAEDTPEPSGAGVGDIQTVHVPDDLRELRSGPEPREIEDHAVEAVGEGRDIRT